MNKKTNLLDFDRESMGAFFSELGERPFRAKQVIQWIHQRGVWDFDLMTDLSKSLREKLKEKTELAMPELVQEQISNDGTRKWLLKLNSGNCIEAVYIPEASRGTLCVSSQVGCALDCTFCATAQQGFNRNLTTSEIIAQLMFAEQRLKKETWEERAVSNVVLMGMGEPLLNFNNVVKATNLMLDDMAYGLSKRRVTLSTAGVVPALERLKEVSDISLAISLHAPNDELRSQLVPLNKKYPIKSVLGACREYIKGKHHRSITIEYIMLRDFNDRPQHARQLAALLRGIPVKINLIPFNPFPGAYSGFERSTDEAIIKFRDLLMAAGYTAITRRTRGEDIDAACGQLAGKVIDKTKRTAKRLRAEEVLAS